MSTTPFKNELAHHLHYICDDDNYGDAFGFRRHGEKVSMHKLSLHHDTEKQAFGAQPAFDAFLVVGGNRHGDSWKCLAVMGTEEIYFAHDDLDGPRSAPELNTPTLKAWADVIERLRAESLDGEQPANRNSAAWVDSPAQLPVASEVRKKMKL